MPAPGVGGFPVNPAPTVLAYINIQDQKAQNTNGGTFTSGADQTRDLNTLVADSAGICSLSNNQFTLPAGTYRIHATAPAYTVNQHQAMLWNVTDGMVQPSTRGFAMRGSVGHSGAGVSSMGQGSIISGHFSIISSKTFEIRHRCTTTAANNGFGPLANFGTEVYTVVEIWREGISGTGLSTIAGTSGVISKRVFSRPTDNVTCTGNNTWNAFGTDWTLSVPGIVSGQYVLLRALVSMNNASNYTGAAFFRVTGGSTYLFGSVTTAFAHVTGTSIEYVDTTPGTGTVVYQIRGGGNTGTVTLRDNADSTFSIDEGNSIFVAEVYTP